ncbi:MAG: hypothetical protein AB7O28_00270 [Vicinamibacterales bacterium]
MTTPTPSRDASFMHLVTLECKDEAHAARCLAALAAHGRPDALAYRCVSYDFGVKVGAPDTVMLVERWQRWEDLDALLAEKVVPALPVYNALLKRPFDPARDTVRIGVA